jgi:CheY-like chemotaxis protein
MVRRYNTPTEFAVQSRADCFGSSNRQARNRMTQQHDGDVLVVAADPEFRALVKHLLSRFGCAIREAGTGEEALTLAEERRPDWVALDVLLPGVTGYVVCQELRELFGEDVWIVFVSGDRTEPADRVAGLLLGADDYVVNPIRPTASRTGALGRRLFTKRFGAPTRVSRGLPARPPRRPSPPRRGPYPARLSSATTRRVPLGQAATSFMSRGLRPPSSTRYRGGLILLPRGCAFRR